MMQATMLVQVIMQKMGDGAVHDNDKHVMVDHDILYIITKILSQIITMHQMSTYVEEKKSSKTIN
jgi:hypothetical protein